MGAVEGCGTARKARSRRSYLRAQHDLRVHQGCNTPHDVKHPGHRVIETHAVHAKAQSNAVQEAIGAREGHDVEDPRPKIPGFFVFVTSAPFLLAGPSAKRKDDGTITSFSFILEQHDNKKQV